ncbi:MAG: transporter substrate-binding domain-containing protein [Rhizobiaceae bacterium]|nr:transporter substrate-binding domain-containing protein [Rhizobiaceae bacterium]
MQFFNRLLTVIAASLVLMSGATLAGAATLDDVKARGVLNCGVNEGLQGFAKNTNDGWQGFDVDFCRAVAAAIFGDDKKVVYLPLSADARFEAFGSGKIDVLSRNSTWTLGRETQYGLTFAGISYHDGQGFMVPRSAQIESSLDLNNKTVCVLEGTTSKANVPDYFVANNMAYELMALESSSQILAAFQESKCNVVTSDVSQLYAWRQLLKQPDEQIILPDTISKEPLGPVVRQGDAAWATLVKWVLYGLINAEEMGISSQTIDQALVSEKPAVMRFVGKDNALGSQLGIGNDWTVNMIRLVGNYGEIFERNLGVDSPLGIVRGMNQLWNLGGILYAPPYR